MSIVGWLCNGCAPAERNVSPYRLAGGKRPFYRYWISRLFGNPCFLSNLLNPDSDNDYEYPHLI